MYCSPIGHENWNVVILLGFTPWMKRNLLHEYVPLTLSFRDLLRIEYEEAFVYSLQELKATNQFHISMSQIFQLPLK